MVSDPYAQRRARILALRDDVTSELEEVTGAVRTELLRARLYDLDGVLDRLAGRVCTRDSVASRSCSRSGAA